MATPPDRPYHSANACAALLARFLREPSELLATFAPEGWGHSPLRRVFHPDDAAEPPVEPGREVVELLGHTLWDIFSDNHSVVDQSGTAYHLGSFRGSAGVIAEALNERYPTLGRRYDYIDFYMGMSLLGRRADASPIYRWIFTGLRDAGCDWMYSFPRLYVVDFSGVIEPNDDPTTYDPSEAVRAELEAAATRKENDQLSAELERAYEEAVERAREAPLPATVAAYRDVFGTLPRGWPHV